MNKLISRNPVQRFKQGRKIVKAQNSWGRNFNKYGYFGGVQKNWKGTRGQLDSGTLGKLQEMGFTYTDEDKNKNEIAKRAQEFLNKFSSENNSLFSNSQIATDNAWGEQSKYALNTLYDLWKELPHTQTSVSTQTPEFQEGLRQQFIKEETPEQQTDRAIVNNVDNLQFKRNGNYNKSGIRDLIRKGGFNPYAYTGAQRKALRLYLNGLSNDTSLLDGTDLARFTLPFRKKGGILPSRNIIKRFKQRNFRQVVQ